MRLESYVLSVCNELDVAGRHADAERLERVVMAQAQQQQEAQPQVQQQMVDPAPAVNPQIQALLQQVQQSSTQAAKAFEDAEQFLQSVYEEGRPVRSTVMKGNMDLRRFMRERTRGAGQAQAVNPYAPPPRMAQQQAAPQATRAGTPVAQPQQPQQGNAQFQQQVPVPDDAQEFLDWLDMKYGGAQGGPGMGGGMPFSLG
jgi:hypothetical protein